MAYYFWPYEKLPIAGDFLSNRKAARVERYTPKTTAAELEGLLMC